MPARSLLRSLAALCVLLLAAPPRTPAAPNDLDLSPDTWSATDALGRHLPMHAETGPVRPGKFVGIFYFIWHNEPDRAVFDITKLLAANPQAPAYGPVNLFQWWGEPLFGYYQSADPFILRKHAQMLADIGVDVLIFDNTNGPTYPDVYLPLCKVFSELRAGGLKVPQIAFLSDPKAARQVWTDFYSRNLYPEMWFRWQGKPLILLKPEAELPDEARDFFTVRRSWAWSNTAWFGDGRDKWPWLDNSPQKPGWHTSPDHPEAINVTMAQHPFTSIGRSYENSKQPPVDEQYLTPNSGRGLYFDEQWRQVLKVDPEFVFVTGWNEWVAQRMAAEADGTFAARPAVKGSPRFIDEFNQEFSRDAEPTKTSLGDNYYYQLAGYIRRYKGTRPLAPVVPAGVNLDSPWSDWQKVSPEYRDTPGDEVHRDFAGGKGIHYTNQTGRNDLLAARVSYDAENVYFHVRARAPLTPSTDPNWMLLFIDADHDAATGWLGYDFVVNRGPVGEGTTTIQRNVGGKYEWAAPQTVRYRRAGNEMAVAVPRKLLGLEKLPAAMDFKWADNIQQTGEAGDFTLNGDAAPNDRFNFRCELTGP